MEIHNYEIRDDSSGLKKMSILDLITTCDESITPPTIVVRNSVKKNEKKPFRTLIGSTYASKCLEYNKQCILRNPGIKDYILTLDISKISSDTELIWTKPSL